MIVRSVIGSQCDDWPGQCWFLPLDKFKRNQMRVINKPQYDASERQRNRQSTNLPVPRKINAALHSLLAPAAVCAYDAQHSNGKTRRENLCLDMPDSGGDLVSCFCIGTTA